MAPISILVACKSFHDGQLVSLWKSCWSDREFGFCKGLQSLLVDVTTHIEQVKVAAQKEERNILGKMGMGKESGVCRGECIIQYSK